MKWLARVLGIGSGTGEEVYTAGTTQTDRNVNLIPHGTDDEDCWYCGGHEVDCPNCQNGDVK